MATKKQQGLELGSTPCESDEYSPEVFNTKLVDIQFRLNAPKTNVNQFQGYKYRTCSDILVALKPILKEKGLRLTITDETILLDDKRVYIKATARITDGYNLETTCAYARESLERKGMDGSQLTGAASSYARKYALNGMFAIDDISDADAGMPPEKADTVVSAKAARSNEGVIAKPVYSAKHLAEKEPEEAMDYSGFADYE